MNDTVDPNWSYNDIHAYNKGIYKCLFRLPHEFSLFLKGIWSHRVWISEVLMNKRIFH